MAASSPNISDFELKVEFRGDYVVHPVHNQEEIWSRGQIIGRGSFGKVFLQKRKGGEQLRVVKEVALAPLGEGGTHQELLAFINTKDYDRYFVKFLGWYKNSYIFFIMEYLKDGDLALYMQDRSRAKENAREITKQILQGLEVLHQKKYNILIASTTKVWVKIADFGVAKQTLYSTAKSGWGTDNYRAPETFSGLLGSRRKISGISYALDIWSLGSLLHELLTSQTPFLEPDLNLTDDELESGLLKHTSPQRMTLDMRMFFGYCSGDTKFPIDILKDSQVSKGGIDFIKRLLTARPEQRPTATIALRNLWLNEYTNIPLKSTAKEAKYSRVSFLKFTPPLEIDVSPLLNAVEAVNADEVAIILNSGVDISSTNCESCFLLAAKLGAFNIVKLFLSNKIYIHTFSGHSIALQTAAGSGHIDTVKLLLDKGASVNGRAVENSGRTALQAAAEGGYIGIVKLLLDKGASVNDETTDDGRTALQAAAGGGHIDIVKLLLANKVDIYTRSAHIDVVTALEAARGRSGNQEIIEILEMARKASFRYRR